jgi:hypothetical protein
MAAHGWSDSTQHAQAIVRALREGLPSAAPAGDAKGIAFQNSRPYPTVIVYCAEVLCVTDESDLPEVPAGPGRRVAWHIDRSARTVTLTVRDTDPAPAAVEMGEGAASFRALPGSDPQVSEASADLPADSDPVPDEQPPADQAGSVITGAAPAPEGGLQEDDDPDTDAESLELVNDPLEGFGEQSESAPTPENREPSTTTGSAESEESADPNSPAAAEPGLSISPTGEPLTRQPMYPRRRGRPWRGGWWRIKTRPPRTISVPGAR